MISIYHLLLFVLPLSLLVTNQQQPPTNESKKVCLKELKVYYPSSLIVLNCESDLYFTAIPGTRFGIITDKNTKHEGLKYQIDVCIPD
jgi:hypothetical protein